MRNILVRPILSEKSSGIEGLGKYVFEVTPSANKIESRRAVESRYNVSVRKVNTVMIKPRRRSRWTGGSVISGATNRRKKAIVTLVEGETIDILANLEGGDLE